MRPRLRRAALPAFGNAEGEWTVGTVPAGQTATLTINYFLLAPAVPTSYAQVLAANETDVDSTPGNGTPPTATEDDEASTVINGGFVPDLVLENLTLAADPVDSGSTLTYTFDIANLGAGSIEQNFLVQSYVSTDEILDADDYQNGSIPTGTFAGGQRDTEVQGATDLGTLAPGEYFLIIQADANGQVLESDESNNLIRTLFTIEANVSEEASSMVDLELTATTANSVVSAFSKNAVTYTIVNAGDTAATGVVVDLPLPEETVYVGKNQFTASKGDLSTFGPRARHLDCRLASSG